MRLVESCQFFPGEAIAGGGSENVVDTGLELLHHGRVYIGRSHAVDIGKAAGLVLPMHHGKVVKERDRLKDERDALRAEVRALKAALEEAESLRQAIAFTLERGVVTDAKKLTVGLRHVPGQKRIDVDRSLWQPYVEALDLPAETAAEQEAVTA